MVQRAREPQHQSAADAPAASTLPYDPEEWKQRVAAARAQREEVLRQRAEEQQPAERGSVGLSGRTNPPVMMPLLGVPALISTVKDEQPKAAGTIPYFNSLRQALASWAQIKGRTPFSGRVPPMLFGLVISALAGASLVSLGATRPGGIDPQNESASPVVSAGPSVDAAPSYATPVAGPPLVTSPLGLGVVPTADAQETAFASLDVLSAPSARGLELPALATAAAAPSMPAIAALPVASEQPGSGPSPDTARVALSLGSREVQQAPFVSRLQLARPPVPAADASPQQLLSNAEKPNMRLAVYVPERLAAERRYQTMTQLSETGWSPEEASTPFTIGKTHVRYYHPQDRAAAEELAASLNTEARDFVSFTPSPEEGYLELWLGGQGAPPKPKPVATRRETPAPVQASGAGRGSEVPQTAYSTASDRLFQQHPTSRSTGIRPVGGSGLRQSLHG